MNLLISKKIDILMFLIVILISFNQVYASDNVNQLTNNNIKDELFSEHMIDEEKLSNFSIQSIVEVLEDTNLSLEDRKVLLEGINNKKIIGFITDLQNATNNMGRVVAILSNELLFNNGQYETRSIIQLENGIITVNLSFNKALPYMLYITAHELDIEVPNFESTLSQNASIFDDYYIRKGAHKNQLVGMRKFEYGFLIFAILLILLIIIKNIFSRLNKNNTKVQTTTTTETNDAKLTAIITAAVCAYMNTSENNIVIKTIKKTNWKKID